MLKVSSRARYGVKVVFELAARFGDGPIPLQLLARVQGVSEPYLEQMMPSLKRAGLVQAVRGAQGGYVLTRAPNLVTVGDVVRALEGPIEVATCTADESHECPDAAGCIGPDVWSRVQVVLVDALDAMTFQDLVRQQRPTAFPRDPARPLKAPLPKEGTA